MKPFKWDGIANLGSGWLALEMTLLRAEDGLGPSSEGRRSVHTPPQQLEGLRDSLWRLGDTTEITTKSEVPITQIVRGSG